MPTSDCGSEIPESKEVPCEGKPGTGLSMRVSPLVTKRAKLLLSVGRPPDSLSDAERATLVDSFGDVDFVR